MITVSSTVLTSTAPAAPGAAPAPVASTTTAPAAPLGLDAATAAGPMPVATLGATLATSTLPRLPSQLQTHDAALRALTQQELFHLIWSLRGPLDKWQRGRAERVLAEKMGEVAEGSATFHEREAWKSTPAEVASMLAVLEEVGDASLAPPIEGYCSALSRWPGSRAHWRLQAESMSTKTLTTVIERLAQRNDPGFEGCVDAYREVLAERARGELRDPGEPITHHPEAVGVLPDPRLARADRGLGADGTRKTTYTSFGGTSLFGDDGPSPFHVVQQGIADCWLLGTLAALAAVRPSVLVRACVVDGDVHRVRLASEHDPERTIPLDADLAVRPGSGKPVYAQAQEVLWPAMMEKAWALHMGGYDELLGIIGNTSDQWPNAVLRALTGAPVVSRRILLLSELAAALAEGHVVTCDGPSADRSMNHLVAVIGVDTVTGEVSLYDQTLQDGASLLSRGGRPGARPGEFIVPHRGLFSDRAWTVEAHSITAPAS
jgi:hypothetical protein